MINILILCAEVIIEHIIVGFIQRLLYLSKNQNKNDFPHHAIIEHRAIESCNLRNSEQLLKQAHRNLMLQALFMLHRKIVAHYFALLHGGYAERADRMAMSAP